MAGVQYPGVNMVELFDVQTGFGGIAAGEKAAASVEALVAEMGRLSIGRSLVRITPEENDLDVIRSNRKLFAACRGDDRLTPCPVLVPATGHDLPGEADQLAEALAEGAGAVILRPQQEYWSLEPWICGALFDALTARRVPVLCLEKFIPPVAAANLAERYPDIPFILAELAYRSHRILLAALRTFPNTFISIGNAFTGHAALVHYVRHVGAERLLFGTGFPAAEPCCAVAQLMYADLGEDEKRLVGAGNMERLLRGIAR